jgi:hypothetical protein
VKSRPKIFPVWHIGLAKSNYKPEITKKYLIMLVYIWLHNKNHIYESGDFYFPPPPQFWQLKTSKISSLFEFVFNFSFWRYLIASKKNGWGPPVGGKTNRVVGINLSE